MWLCRNNHFHCKYWHNESVVNGWKAKFLGDFHGTSQKARGVVSGPRSEERWNHLIRVTRWLMLMLQLFLKLNLVVLGVWSVIGREQCCYEELFIGFFVFVVAAEPMTIK